MSTQKGTLINKYTPNYVIFDLETTGISPNYDEVIEISALKVKGGEVVDEFNTLVNPGRKIPFGYAAGGAKTLAEDGASSSGGSGGALWYFIGRCASSTE